MPEVEINCPVYPSEDPEKVSAAVLKIFPDVVLERTDRGFEGKSGSLDLFSSLIRKQKILDTTRSVMLRASSEDRTTFFLNKQVATTGKVSFTEERTVLGSIRVIVRDPDMQALIDRVAPVTVDGEEVRI